MSAIGSLRVELELDDGSFTTRVIRAGTTLRQLNNQVDGTVVAVRRMDSTLGNLGTALKNSVVTLGLARAAIENVYSVFGAWAVSIARVSGEMERLNTLLRGMSDGVTEVERAASAGAAVRYLNDLARSAPFALNDLTAAFVRLRAGGIEDTERTMRGLVDAVSAFGGSATQLERASIALQQMAGKGVISMEELRQQLGEAVPSALPLMARSLSTSVDDLVQRISNGQVRAQPALQALSAEFERTFGGSAQAMMRTFNGQIMQFQNNWMRLQTRAGGLNESGEVMQGGFLYTLTQGLTRLNELLMSPGMQGAAIRLGQMLTGVTKSLIGMADWVERNADILLRLGAVAGGLLAAQLAFSAARMLAVAVNASILGSATIGLIAGMRSLYAVGIPALVAGLALLRNALLAVTAASATNALFAGLMNAGLVLGTLSVVATRTFGSIVAGAGAAALALRALSFASIGNAMTTALLGAGLALGTLQATAARAFGAMIAWMASASAATLALRVALVGLAAAGGVGIILGAFSLLGGAIDWLRRKYAELTRDAGAAYERIRQGATDTATLAAAQAEANAVANAVATAKRQLEELRAFQRGEGVGRVRNLEGISGEGVLADAGRASIRRNADGSFDAENLRRLQQAIADRERIRTEGERLTAERVLAIQRATASREQQLAEQAATRMEDNLQDSMRVQRAEYAQFGRDIENARRAIDGAFNDGNLGREERDRQILELNRRNLESQLTLYTQEREAWQTTLDQALNAQAQALQDRARIMQEATGRSLTAQEQELLKRNAQTLREQEAFINKAEENLKRIGKSAEEARATFERGPGNGAFGAANDITTRERQAETMLRNLNARIAELRAQSMGLGGELERVNSLIQSGLFNGLRQSTIDDIRAAATAVDEFEERLRRFRAGQQGLQRIETGLDQAQRDLQGYIDRLTDPNLTDAQRRFIEFQRQMQAALQAVGAAADETGRTYADAANRVAQALNAARASIVLSDLEGLVQEGQRGRVSAAAPGADRIAEQTRQAQARIAAVRAGIQEQLRLGTMTQAAVNQALSQLSQAEQGILAGINATGNRSIAAAGARTENTITRLTARLAELRESTIDGSTETARYAALIEGMGGASSAAGQRILQLTQAIDAEMRMLEKGRRALQAYQDIERQLSESQTRTEEYQLQLDDPNRAEGNRQLVVFMGRAQQAIRLATEFRDALRATNDPRLPIAEARLTDVTRIQGEAVAQRAAELASQNAVQMNNAERQIRQGLAETNAERRRIGEDNINIERDQAFDLIRLSNLTGQERIRAEEAVSRFIERRREELYRQTENALDRQMRSWGAANDNRAQVWANGFDRMMDVLDDFVEGSEIRFGDLAKAFLMELAKMEARAAISQVWGFVRGGVSSLFGGGGAGGSTGSVTTADTSAGGFLFHRGGMVGSEGAPLGFAPASLWHNAPRFHSGTMLRNDEVAAVLQKGEGVFTAGQIAEIGRMNHSYTAVERMLGKMTEALSPPRYIEPNPIQPRQANDNRPAAAGGVSVNLINQSGTQLEATSGAPRFDGEGMVLDVVIRNLQRPGKLRDAVRGAM